MSVTKLNPIGDMNALKRAVDKQLTATQWWMLPDSQLSELQQTEAAAWRLQLMNVVNESTFETALNAYYIAISQKPNWSL